MLKLIILSVIILGIAVLAMALRIFIKKNGTMKSFHIEDNEEMKARGIKCAKCEEMGSCSINPGSKI